MVGVRPTRLWIGRRHRTILPCGPGPCTRCEATRLRTFNNDRVDRRLATALFTDIGDSTKSRRTTTPPHMQDSSQRVPSLTRCVASLPSPGSRTRPRRQPTSRVSARGQSRRCDLLSRSFRTPTALLSSDTSHRYNGRTSRATSPTEAQSSRVRSYESATVIFNYGQTKFKTCWPSEARETTVGVQRLTVLNSRTEH